MIDAGGTQIRWIRGPFARRSFGATSRVEDRPPHPTPTPQEHPCPTHKLVAETRTQFGKGAARKIRRDHKIPAVMYGHGTEPVHITLPGHETMLALKHANALLTIVIDGDEQLALAKDVQRDPIKPVIEHVDLVIVRKGEKVVVDVPVHLEGEAAPETVVTTDHTSLQLEVVATAHPREHHRLGRGPRRPAPRSSPARSSCPRAPPWSPTRRRSSSTSPRRSPRRPSRPSSPRPRPRPASSARSPTRRPPRPPSAAEGAAAEGEQAPTRPEPPSRSARRTTHGRARSARTGPRRVPGATAYWSGDRHRTLARRRAGQPRPGVRRQPAQRRRHGRRRARPPAPAQRAAHPQGPRPRRPGAARHRPRRRARPGGRHRRARAAT